MSALAPVIGLARCPLFSNLPPSLLLLLLTCSLEKQQVAAKRIWSNEAVVSCNEVVEAWSGPEGGWEGLNGTLTSPNYPLPYPPRRQCRVDLKAPQGYRVRLTFTHFHLYHPLNLSNNNCEAMDSVIVKEVEGKRLGRYCGPGVPLPIMSSSTHLTLVFRSITSGPHVTGYRALYTFLSDFGLESGEQVMEHSCMFQFNSTSLPRGEIQSPNPGGRYPRNTVCQYVFLGEPHQRIRLTFSFFDVEGVAPCSEKTDSDYIEFSNMEIENSMLPRRCGRFAPKVVESEGPEFQLTFRSNHKYDGLGFAAEYQFVWRQEEEEEEEGVVRPLSLPASGGCERTKQLVIIVFARLLLEQLFRWLQTPL